MHAHRKNTLIWQSGPEGVSTYSYDVQNRLTRVVTPDGVWEYEYDAFGNRTASIVNGERTEFLVDPRGLGNVIGIYDGSGARTTSYTHGFGLESTTNASGTYFFDFDAIGSTSGISTADGDYINEYAFTPFGQSLLSNEVIVNPFEFIGRSGVMNEDNGLHFMRARYYRTGDGRFLSQDPMRIRPDNNLYRYTGNNPISMIDSNGLFATEISGFAGAGLGAGFSISIGPCGISSNVQFGAGAGAGVSYGAGVNTSSPGSDGRSKWEVGFSGAGTIGPYSKGVSYSEEIGNTEWSNGEIILSSTVGGPLTGKVGLGGFLGVTFGGTASWCDPSTNSSAWRKPVGVRRRAATR